MLQQKKYQIQRSRLHVHGKLFYLLLRDISKISTKSIDFETQPTNLVDQIAGDSSAWYEDMEHCNKLSKLPLITTTLSLIQQLSNRYGSFRRPYTTVHYKIIQ